PEYSLAYNQLGFAYRAVNRLDSAESVFRRYIALVPNDPNPYDSYAELLMKMGRFDESITQYRKALSIDPHFGGSFVGIGADQMYSGRYAAASDELQQYYKSARDDSERRTALLNLAMIDVDNHATDAAIGEMERSFGIASATGDTTSMSADGIVAADILLAAGRIDSASSRYRRAHDLVAASSASAAVKQDNELARHYDMSRVALAKHDVRTARAEAAAYLTGATGARNDARVRQARELNGLVALEAKEYAISRTELALADQDNPAVIYAMSHAYAGEGNAAKARKLAGEALHMNILPSLPYVVTRAALASATGLATAGTLP
ncbi:MAG: tetratricopeptide repeat protein, partial [Gemmatimonadaceae bacterium]